VAHAYNVSDVLEINKFYASVSLLLLEAFLSDVTFRYMTKNVVKSSSNISKLKWLIFTRVNTCITSSE